MATGVGELTVGRRAMACEFSVVFPEGSRDAITAGCEALDEVERLEQRLSVFRDDSAVARINREAADGPVAVDAEVFELLRFAMVLSRATAGAFDIATGALLRAWGFQGGGRRVPEGPERMAALERSGSRHVVLDEARRTVGFRRAGVELNLGAVGKGYAIDRAASLLRRRFRSALVQGGQSSLYGIGCPPDERRGWMVEIGDPSGGRRAVARAYLRNRALGTSGAANQSFVSGGRRYGHILDPRTGWPASGVESVSALAPTAAEADALSTAFYVMGAEGTREFCRRHPRVGAVLVHGEVGDRAPRVELIGAQEAEVV